MLKELRPDETRSATRQQRTQFREWLDKAASVEPSANSNDAALTQAILKEIFANRDLSRVAVLQKLHRSDISELLAMKVNSSQRIVGASASRLKNLGLVENVKPTSSLGSALLTVILVFFVIAPFQPSSLHQVLNLPDNLSNTLGGPELWRPSAELVNWLRGGSSLPGLLVSVTTLFVAFRFFSRYRMTSLGTEIKVTIEDFLT